MTIKSLFCSIVLSLASASVGFAQGTAFTYQGRLNFNGSPANGSYDFQFIVYDNNPGGAQQGPIRTNTATAVSGGLFTVILDFGQIFPGANRWLDISVRTNGASPFIELSPRQPLTPTPYAITAGGVTPGAGLAGTYGGAVTLSNTANSITGTFTGNGANVANVNAATLNGLNSANFWQLGGNNVASTQFLGSTNNQPLQIMVNSQPVMQLAYASNVMDGLGPTMIVGTAANFVSNGVVGATISGGGSTFFGPNSIGADFGTVLGGAGNTANGRFSIAGGVFCASSGVASVALGNSFATGDDSVALGESSANGLQSSAMGESFASGEDSTAMGHSSASGVNSTAMGQSSAVGDYSTALGHSTAVGQYSFAAGAFAAAEHDGCFVWADDSDFLGFASTASNQFLIRATGGVILDGASDTDLNFGSATRQMVNLFGTSYGLGVQNNTLYQRSNARFSWFKGGSHVDLENLPGTGGSVLMTLTSGGLTVNGTLASMSDRNAKQDFAPVNSREVLDKVATLPITEWIYKTDTDTRHIGPMAQDFYAAFAVGMDDKHIATLDEGGVALAAIQGLNQKLENEAKEKDAEIQKLKRQNDSLAERLNALEASVKQLAAP